MKLISVQSRGDRLVKVWEVDYIGFQVSWKQIEVGLRGFVFMGYANYPELDAALSKGAEWLEGAAL